MGTPSTSSTAAARHHDENPTHTISRVDRFLYNASLCSDGAIRAIMVERNEDSCPIMLLAASLSR